MNRPALILLALLALPAQAGMFDDEIARERVDKLRADFTALSERVDLATKNQFEFANQTEALRADMARLRGQIEVLLNDMETTQKRQRDFYVDLDTRLRKLETSTAQTAETKPPSGTEADPAKETHDYEAALAAFKSGKYKDAIAAFQAFATTHPSSSLLPNAYYWTASGHYQLKDYRKAAEIFDKVAATWPNDPKAPDALLAEGNALTEAGDAKGAKKVLQALVAQYPGTPAALTAKQRLKK
jgi:tol-pal system protein YbgF